MSNIIYNVVVIEDGMRCGDARSADFTVDLDASAEDAWCLDTGDENAIFVPKSLCEFDKHLFQLTIPEWLAIEKGLE